MAVIFDLDGTLMDPQGGIRTAIEAAFVAGGVPAVQPGEHFVGMPLHDVIATRTEDPVLAQTMIDEFLAVSVDAVRQATWYPGMEAIAKEFSPCGIVTLKSRGELLSQMAPYSYFGALIGGDMATPKPDPSGVLEACRILEADPKTSIMVGDTHSDIEAGRRAGCTTVGVTWGFGYPEGDYTADSADMLNGLLRDLHNG